jgi:hypothetical protein
MHITVHIQKKVMLRNNNEKIPTSYGLEDQQMCSTSEYLEANATLKEKMVEWESLTLVWTKSTCWLLKYKENIQVLQFEVEQSCGKHQCNN